MEKNTNINIINIILVLFVWVGSLKPSYLKESMIH